MEQINIMVFPCGSEIGLELHRSLKDIRFINLFGASSVDDHGVWVYKNYIGSMPFITADDFIRKFNECIDENHIDYIFPALDNVIAFLSRHRDELHAELLTSPDDAVQVCRSKSKTYSRLDGCDFLPGIYKSADEVKDYPVIIKPAESQGSQGFMIVKDEQALRYELSSRQEEQVICEYLPGEEYTIDCFTDKDGRVRYVSSRNRNRIKNGISVNSTLQKPEKRIFEIAETINSKIKFRGVWFFQLKRNVRGEYRLLECATRVAGTMCVERAAGVNLALLTVFDALGYELNIPKPLSSVTVDRALCNVFKLDLDYDEVYMDFDDTLVVHDRVNFTALRFIYQCIEQGKRVVLLTRHETDIISDLRAKRLSPEMFDEIICIARSQRKIDNVRPSAKALFIDDSFAERKAMSEAYGTVCLGVDAVEALIDERQ